MPRRKLFSLLLTLIGFFAFSILIVENVSAERALIVGDSITGHSMNLKCGYIHEIRRTLAENKITDLEVIPFGGSGQRVESWIGILKRSEKDRQQLDIKGIFVKDELDKKADTIVIFLGMNDALCPTVRFTDESFRKWKTDYQTLIDGLKARTDFKKLILCPPTMLTENPYSAQNLLMDRMGDVLKEIAKENNAVLCDLRGIIKKHFLNARLADKNFFFTPDSVHPRDAGHSLIAWALLRSLNREQIAEKYYEEHIPEILKNFSAPGMSLFVVNSDRPDTVLVRGHLRGEKKDRIKVDPPAGMRTERIIAKEGDEFEILLSGHSSELRSELTVSAGGIRRSVDLIAPFFVTTPFSGQIFSDPGKFDWDREKTEIDLDILAGKNPLKSKMAGKPVSWIEVRPNANETGRSDPNTVDFASVADMYQYDKGYLVRKIDSPKEQKAVLKINPRGFSTTVFSVIYLNGKEIWRGAVSPRLPKHSDEVIVDLKQGKNVLAARVNHTQWQWAISLELDAEGLKY
ncbi:MAG: GDSL-type esterase/lipase family protein [Planctomycetia bacterium]|nr:GDSL-type esterase/lipase family protein [Planctomycetia bacterium]